MSWMMERLIPLSVGLAVVAMLILGGMINAGAPV